MIAVVPLAGCDEAELLRLAASLERGSEHPLAAADRARRRRSAGSRSPPVGDFDSPVRQGRARA